MTNKSDIHDASRGAKGVPFASKKQSAISTKLFLALGFITITVIVTGIASIVAVNRFQENFDALINTNMPTLADTAQISRLSVTVADRGANLIISPNTWTRINIIAQVEDDARWMEEILDRIPDNELSGNRKVELLVLKASLVSTYNTLNILTENRIIYAERLTEIDQEMINMQQDLVSLQFGTNMPDGSFVPSGSLQQWSESIHATIFKLMEARDLQHTAPLKRLQRKVASGLKGVNGQLPYLPAEAQQGGADIIARMDGITDGKNGLFNIKRLDLNATNQIDATLRNARTIAEQFMVASELATHDIRSIIDKTNQQTSQSMNITLRAMVGFILVSVLIAIVTFLYVSRTVLRRLGALRRSMLAHAEGEDETIDTSGNDEITEMGQSLQYLVDALHSREVGLTQAKEVAEQASTAKTRFLAAASHDLRQPLQALNLFVYALEGKEKDEEKREIISLIRNSLDSLKELLNTLLDISKLEAGVVQPNLRNFTAGAMIERIKSELTAVAWANDLELRTVTTSCGVYSDPALLEIVVRNLVDNAIKYTEQGKVLIGCRVRADKLRFEVWDTGPGIPADQHELIFHDFYQVDNEARRRTHGLGLGLSIVKRTADLLGCSMGCTSKPGQGSMFWVEAPLSIVQPVLDRRAPLRLNETVHARGNAHIAIIEDDEQVLAGLKSLLEGQGYTTIAFPVANRKIIEETFAHKRRHPDLIIADYRLEAQVTGREVISMIREILGDDIPAIIVTGDTAPERLREAKESGFPILHKPVRPEELIAMVTSTLSVPGDDATPDHAHEERG